MPCSCSQNCTCSCHQAPAVAPQPKPQVPFNSTTSAHDNFPAYPSDIYKAALSPHRTRQPRSHTNDDRSFETSSRTAYRPSPVSKRQTVQPVAVETRKSLPFTAHTSKQDDFPVYDSSAYKAALSPSRERVPRKAREDNRSFGSTTRDTYKQHKVQQNQIKPVQPRSAKSIPFTAHTSKQDEFPMYSTDTYKQALSSPRQNKKPRTINDDRAFETTTRASHKKHDVQPQNNRAKPVPVNVRRSIPFNATTSKQDEYKQYDTETYKQALSPPRQRTERRRPDDTRDFHSTNRDNYQPISADKFTKRSKVVAPNVKKSVPFKATTSKQDEYQKYGSDIYKQALSPPRQRTDRRRTEDNRDFHSTNRDNYKPVSPDNFTKRAKVVAPVAKNSVPFKATTSKHDDFPTYSESVYKDALTPVRTRKPRERKPDNRSFDTDNRAEYHSYEKCYCCSCGYGKCPHVKMVPSPRRY
ncbi:hypothetical protein PCE1_000172 [Barthelona sp. PCE]